jgi:hypothetical protein
LRKNPVEREGFGEVKFSRLGRDKLTGVSLSDPERLKLLPAVKPLIEKGDYIGRAGAEGRSDGMVAFHYFEGNVKIGNQTKFIGVSAAEDRNGNRFYNLTESPDVLLKNKSARLAQMTAGGDALSNDSIPEIFNLIIITFEAGVNMNLTFDRASARARDENGFMRVTGCNITKETVNPYHGKEIPGWRGLGLNPDAVYRGYRSGEELRASIPTWQGLPLLLDHHVDSATAPQKKARVGAIGTDLAWAAPYLTASLTVWDAAAQQEIESGAFKELSCAYAFTADFTPGVFAGQKYDFVMRNIKGNHVALVREGRAGPDVVVADGKINPKPMEKEDTTMDVLDKIKAFLDTLKTEEKGALPAGVNKDNEPPAAKPAEPAAKPAEPAAKPAEPAAPAKAVKDDEPGSLGAELYALIDSLQDTELAAKIKAKIDEIRAGEKAAKAENKSAPAPAAPAPAPETPAPAPGQDPAAKNITALDSAIRQFASDAAKVKEQTKAEAKAEAQNHFRSLYEAARKVRPLVGELDAMAFDSAGDIYRHALKQSGAEVKTIDASALAEMVGVVLDARRNTAAANFTGGINKETGSLASILGVSTSV